MNSITDPELVRLLKRPEMVGFAKKLATVESGYYSNPELGHRVAGSDNIDRTLFYRLVDALEKCGELECIAALHNKATMRIVHIDGDHLRDLFANVK